MRAKVVLGWTVAGILLISCGRYEWKRVPPYQRGFHPSLVEAQVSRTRTDAPHIGNCPVFPADNVWNTPIDKLPKDPHAGAYVDGIGPLHKIHPDFGSNLNTGIPFTDVPPGTRPVHVDFEYRDESDLGNYPIPPDAPIEGGVHSDGDRHILLIDQRRCLLYELWAARQKPDGSWAANS